MTVAGLLRSGKCARIADDLSPFQTITAVLTAARDDKHYAAKRLLRESYGLSDDYACPAGCDSEKARQSVCVNGMNRELGAIGADPLSWVRPSSLPGL